MKKPRPVKAIGSKRRAAGWMLLTLGLLVAAVWVWSFERGGRWGGKRACAGLGRGQMYISIYGTMEVPFASLQRGELYGSSGWSLDAQPKLERPTWRTQGLMVFEPFPIRLPTPVRQDWMLVEYISFPPYASIVYAVLWPLPLMLWTTGGLSLWSGRRARRRALEGHCPTCGYNLAGLNRDAGACPECRKAKAAT